MGIGQLLDYARFVEPRPRLALLLPSEPRPDLLELLKSAEIGALWPAGAKFATHNVSLEGDPRMQPDHTPEESLSLVLRDLARTLAAYETQLPTDIVNRWKEVMEMLEVARGEIVDGSLASAQKKIEQAETILRTELGQMNLPFLPQEIRYAALDAHKVLYRRFLQ
jgi:hypothetical protein